MSYTFEQAQSEFAKARNPYRGRPLANNTRLVKTTAVDVDGELVECYGIQLHATVVVYILPSGNYKLNSGGWTTVTTQSRLNQFSPARVYSEYVRDENGGHVKDTWSGKPETHWVVSSSEVERVTPPKVKRCRTCKGLTYKVRIQTHSHGNAENGWKWEELPEPVEHHDPCYRCGQTGEVDYGSHKIHPAFFDGIFVDAAGQVVEAKAKVAA